MITLKQLLNVDNYDNYKIRFNMNNGEIDPIELFTREPEVINTQWLFWRGSKRYFNVGENVISLVRISYDTWLLTTIKSIDEELGIENGINYKGTEDKEYSSLYGRVVIKFHKNFQTSVRHANNLIEELEVLQVLPTIYDDINFPGYDSVNLTYTQLKDIVDRNKLDWVNALESQKGVYMILDNKTGKQYVGSAYGENGMLLQRWRSYVVNGHGGNKSLVELVNKEGIKYVKENFSYVLLENFNSRVDSSYIIRRESWWKEALGSRKFGYNNN